MKAAKQPIAGGTRAIKYGLNTGIFASMVLSLFFWGCFLVSLDIHPGPDALPDPGNEPLRKDQEIDHLRVPSFVREVHEPISLSLHFDDAGGFMNHLMHQAEASGGYVLDSRYYSDAFEPSFYNRLVLMVPESFVRDMQPLRDGGTDGGKAIYREWFFSRDFVSVAPPIARDLVKVTVEAKYHGWGSVGGVEFKKLYMLLCGFFFLMGPVCIQTKNRLGLGTPSGHAVDNEKMKAKPEPTLQREDLEWTRDGDVIRGSYRDFIIHMKTFPETQRSKLFVTVQVLRTVRSVSVGSGSDRADSHDEAIEKGLSVIRRHLEADRATEQTFDILVGKPSTSRVAQSQMASAGRSRESFQRYMA